jgi:hypothetical protein
MKPESVIAVLRAQMQSAAQYSKNRGHIVHPASLACPEARFDPYFFAAPCLDWPSPRERIDSK